MLNSFLITSESQWLEMLTMSFSYSKISLQALIPWPLLCGSLVFYLGCSSLLFEKVLLVPVQEYPPWEISDLDMVIQMYPKNQVLHMVLTQW
jgi:hypothetical protein